MAQSRGRFDYPRPGMEKVVNVINRLLDKGDLEAARWVLRHFSRELIAETLRTKRDFALWTALFWARYIGIPREEVKCLQESYYSLRKTFWPY